MAKKLTRDNYYIQTNNPTEQALRQYGSDSWLVSCGPTAAINCIAPLGYPVEVKSPTGKWTFQPEELLMDFLIDPRNRPKLQAIRSLPEEISKQEVPQYYPYAVSVLFGATARFDFGPTFQDVFSYVSGNGTVQLCLKSPGHYISVVDSSGSWLYYNDSWPQRFEDGNGFLRRMSRSEFQSNVKEFAIWYV